MQKIGKNEMISEEDMKRGIETIKEFHKGNYRSLIEFEMEIFGYTKTEALENCRRRRIESRHTHWVGICSDGLKSWHWPHCKCGWQGSKVDTYEEAMKIKCPNRLRQLKNYRLEDKEFFEV